MIDRKVLSDLAIREPAAFEAIVEKAKAALRGLTPVSSSDRRACDDRCAYVQRMARYNRWQNENLYSVADRLSDDERRRERGAFFGSIHKTLSHLLVGRSHLDEPVRRCRRGRRSAFRRSVSLYPDWDDAEGANAPRFDAAIVDWADTARRRRGSPAI